MRSVYTNVKSYLLAKYQIWTYTGDIPPTSTQVGDPVDTFGYTNAKVVLIAGDLSDLTGRGDFDCEIQQGVDSSATDLSAWETIASFSLNYDAGGSDRVVEIDVPKISKRYVRIYADTNQNGGNALFSASLELGGSVHVPVSR